jgi:putative peptidoglycan lipid II flippase
VRAFYARQDARTPLWAGLATAALFISLCFILTPAFGYLGVAMANTCAYSFEAVLLLVLLWRREMNIPADRTDRRSIPLARTGNV